MEFNRLADELHNFLATFTCGSTTRQIGNICSV
jgi:hypothetical protein